jgi:hypothetical protein
MRADAEDAAETRNPEVREDGEGVSALVVAAALLVAIVGGGLLSGGAFLFLRVREGHLRPSGVFSEQTLPAPHRVADVLQEPFEVGHPRPDLRERQRRALREFAWIDRSRGLVRIPIDLAIDVAAGNVR